MPPTIRQTKFLLFICSFSTLLGCRTPLSPETKAQTPRVFAIYTSDAPSLLPYFSLPFTERLKHEFVLTSALKNETPPALAYEQELKQSQPVSSSAKHNLETMVRALITSVRSNQQKQVTLEQAYHTCLLANERIKNIFLLEHEPLSRNAFAELSFWCSVTGSRLQKTLKDNLSIYSKYASLSFKDSLENQTNNSVARELRNSANRLHLTQQKLVQFNHPASCHILVNGEELKEPSLSLPEYLESVVSAVCHNGSFATVFTPHKTTKVTILPSKQTSGRAKETLASSTNIRSLQFDKNAQFAIFIHWDQKNKYLDCRVESLPNFIPVNSMRLPLKTTAAQNKAGDTLIQFLKVNVN